jgi:hypothetical protein
MLYSFGDVIWPNWRNDMLPPVFLAKEHLFVSQHDAVPKQARDYAAQKTYGF